ncbi:universal archaeal metal-binding-domain/4Fe-4S-binding-domain containing ABC transporter, ATP-binding protein [Halovivax ruber XH-70]|uniref:Universal archaeal metal-binding-domain/4Fe-4S-binding-domain containing ABC transporter, ATP-binding protein n=1 Tax=Halovivax ruber (strain DSM 18193 / JCM 13892 / XH-70) TaxID=797302 RepID=L0IC96_HALRX|nr:diphthine--ammonia ligase [Halovivax ruber]AGB15826.1 universal archaeal metal-binding-domain/4Fe-4S-binding-domain containing ABC transporter, ATP-binding protein [Halovivax ruber XH-70]
MTEASGAWVSLFSGGKDSSYALYLALERGIDVDRLLTIHPEGDSYMYHVPATELATLAADSIGIRSLDVHPDSFETEEATDSGTQGDREVEPLETALRSLAADTAGGIAGLVVGAVESEYQRERVERLCTEFDCELFAPLWQADPRALATDMLAADFEIVIVQVAAHGLDESWLGRPLDHAAIDELETLADSHGVHLLGEGGEFETMVLDAPHMDRRLDIEYETTWDGTRGSITVTDASLE